MRSTIALTLATALAILSAESNAGPGSSSSGGSRGSAPAAATRGGTSVAAGAGGRASAPAARGATSTGPSASGRSSARPAAARPYGQLGARRSHPARQSLLASGKPPSPHLTQIIRERERSGPGWIGTAVLIALLSQHDLSASDKSWIQGKINALDEEGEDNVAQALLPPVQRPMSITGVAQPLHAGQSTTITVAASGMPADAVACNIEGAAAQPVVSARDRVASLSWTPERAGAYILKCRAGKHIERRILRVAANN